MDIGSFEHMGSLLGLTEAASDATLDGLPQLPVGDNSLRMVSPLSAESLSPSPWSAGSIVSTMTPPSPRSMARLRELEAEMYGREIYNE